MYDWVSEDFYYDEYVGNIIPNNELKEYLSDACEYLDLICNGQISSYVNIYGFDNLSKIEKEKINISACQLGEFLFTHKEDLYPTNSSFTIDDLNVNNRFSEAYSEVNRLRVPPQIYLRMKQTRFMNRTTNTMLLKRYI